MDTNEHEGQAGFEDAFPGTAGTAILTPGGYRMPFTSMTANARQVLDEALRLPKAERELLAEKLVESLVTSLDPEIEQAHLHAVHERQAEYRAGRTKLLEADIALKQIRAAIRR